MWVCRQTINAAGRPRRSESQGRGLRVWFVSGDSSLPTKVVGKPLIFGLMCKGVERQASHLNLTMKSAPFA